MNAGGFVALAGVAPVEDEAAAVGAGADFDAAKPWIVAEEDIGLVFANVAAAIALQTLHVGASAVHVEGEELVAVFDGPLIGLVDHHADVRVAATEVVGLAIAGFAPRASAVVVVVIGDGVELLVDQRIRRVGIDKVGAVNEVPQVAGDGVDEKHLAVRIPVVAPRVCGAVSEDFDDFCFGMEAPDSAFHRHALVIGCARNTELTGAGMTAAAVEPAIGAKAETVGEVVVVRLGHGEAVEHDFGFAIGDVIAIAIWNEEHLRRAHEPHAATTDFDAGEHLHVVCENFARLGDTVPVLVFENDHAVLQSEVEALRTLGVGVVFCHPHAPLCIPSHADGILHIGFCGKERGLETFRQFERFQGLLRRHGRRISRLAVVGRGEVGAERGGGEEGEGEQGLH